MEQTETGLVFKKDSVNLLLATAKAEYDNEHNRSSIIDTKTNISLPIISTFFLALVQLNNYKYIFSLPTETFSSWLLPATLFFSYTLALIFGMSSVFLMTRVIFTRNYKTLKIRDLYDEDYLKNDCIFFSTHIFHLYCDCTEYNKKQNDGRVKLYKHSWILMFATLCFYLIYIITKTNT